MNKILKLIELERKRQKEVINLIASENYVSDDILKAQGSILTNKYAEGYPKNRYYGGCKYIDEIEEEAIELATKLFDVSYANVQPHSGSSANMAVYKALLNIGDTVLGMNLNDGGHITHGLSINFSGKEYNIISYKVNPDTNLIDYDEIRKLATEHKPKMIIAGATAYSGKIDFSKFREICDEVGSYLMIDIAHVAGLVAAGYYPNPCKYADVVTLTTQKTLRGPRGGIILSNNEEIMKKINRTVFPGLQGGPLMHVIAAKAICFKEAMSKEYKKYIKNVLENSNVMVQTFMNLGKKIVSNQTETHLFLLDVKSSYNLTGLEAQNILENVGIIVNKNTIPYDELSPKLTSGIRIGTPAMTTRGLNKKNFIKIAKLINMILINNSKSNQLIVKNEVKRILEGLNK